MYKMEEGEQMHSIRRQVISLFLLISLTLIGMIYGVTELELTRNIVPLNTSITQQMVDDRAGQIDGWFGERLSELRVLAHLPAQRTYTQGQLFNEIKAVTKLDRKNYVSIRLVTQDGISHSTNHPNFSVRNRAYFKELQRHPYRQYTVSNSLISKEDQRSIVIVLYRLPQPLKDHTAYIAAAIPLAKVEALAHDLSIYDGKGILLGGDSDSPQVNPQKELLLTTKLECLPRWKVNYIVQKRDLRGSTQQLIRLLLVIALVVIGLLGLLLILLLRRIIRPITELTNTMKQIQSGGRDIRATVQGPQEIQDLAVTFNKMLVQVYENEAKYREASIQVLQAQIQPHFLYNTLDTIQWQILGGDTDDAVTMIENLSMFFRKGLNHGQEVTTLRDEIAHVTSYFKIQAIRFPKLRAVKINIPDKLMDQPVMHFILQPLVENAINHGLRPSANQQNQLTITGQSLDGSRMRLTITNNGVPIAPSLLESLNDGSYQAGQDGYGIYNVSHRLKLFYNGMASLRFTSTEEMTTVELELPMIDAANYEGLKGEYENATTDDC